ncbi:hypothetical protein BO99DRAFT_19008 [Aspergillus violaceofuscus CBS 115571]|uniref:Uncharacterized protein n=1 Tax=Aspergillus violaceofuscus (strain CBS 115571) TaxID=1450538 RepID=A0A2V5HD69_ASPV1|nr:hypothetical protein BO99DRAFT_19008 [Aspergillus violaceofuscus CBS 115571]
MHQSRSWLMIAHSVLKPTLCAKRDKIPQELMNCCWAPSRQDLNRVLGGGIRDCLLGVEVRPNRKLTPDFRPNVHLMPWQDFRSTLYCIQVDFLHYGPIRRKLAYESQYSRHRHCA